MNVICVAKTMDDFGNSVNGHIHRVSDVISLLDVSKVYYEENLYNAQLRYKVIDQNDTVIILDDGCRIIDIRDGIKCAVITDEPELLITGADPIVVTGSDNDLKLFGDVGDFPCFSGIHATIITPLTRKHQYNGYDSNDVLLIPGGAKNTFHRNMFESGITDMITDSGLNAIFVEGLPREELFSMACDSKLVICTPSVVSTEMLAMGVPFIAVETADDQQGNMDTYIYNGIPTNESPMHELEGFIDDPQPSPIIVNKYHIDRVAKIIKDGI